MRLDHIAFRVEERAAASKFFIDAFGYKIQTEFDLKFDDGTTTKCIALEPPEKLLRRMPWTEVVAFDDKFNRMNPVALAAVAAQIAPPIEEGVYHLAPEIFISDGEPDSIVGQWVTKHGPGIHHLAYMVESVEKTMKEWKQKGYAEFTSDEPMRCADHKLVQVFTKPSELTGVIFEFIERGEHGFCGPNVKALMESTKIFS